MDLGHWKDGEHYYPFRVFYHHTDAGGIVYYARYFEIAEEARAAALVSLGIAGYPGAFEGDFVVRSLSANYERSARLGDEILVATRFLNPRGASMTAVQRIYVGGAAAKAAVDMTTELVWVGERHRPARIPGKILEALE